MILVLETGYVFGWLVAMVLNLIVPHETGDPMERIRAARKAKGLVVPLSEEEGRAIEENQIHNPKMGFEGDSAHPTPVVVPVSLARCQPRSTCAAAWLSHLIGLWRESVNSGSSARCLMTCTPAKWLQQALRLAITASHEVLALDLQPPSCRAASC